MKICIVGASGYTGLELIRILSEFEDININQIVSRQYNKQKLSDVFPHFQKSKYQDLLFQEDVNINESDFFFLCLPHQPSVELVRKIITAKKKVIDLSAAYRIKKVSAYPEYYGFEHSYPDILEKAVYGLPEIFREDIEKADLVANPGCYPTATLLALYPAVKEGILTEDTVVVNALSGISGAGRGLKQQFHYPEAYSDFYAYSPTKHRHTPEMEDIIERVSGKKYRVRFTPHIVPVSRGMVSTVVFSTNLNKKQLTELYRLEYRYEPFIRFVSSPPHTKNVIGSNFCDIYVDLDEKTGQAVIITAIDNLGKGASSQAVQNFNIMTGNPEDKNLKSILSIIYP